MLAFLVALRLFGFFTEPRLDHGEIHAVAGEPDLVVTAPARPDAVVVTWNLERGVEFERIAATLADIDADILLLQEVDRFCDRSGRRDVARDLARRLNLNWTIGGEFQEIGEGARGSACVTGQAILSRWPIAEAAVVRFARQASMKWSFNPVQPRRGGRIALRAATGGVVVYSVHLESGQGSESLRVRQLAEVRDAAGPAAGPVIVGGDFNNAGGRDSELLRLLPASGFASIVDPTGGSGPAARRPIDWIFARGLDGTGSVVRAEAASDHDPIVVRLRAAPARQ